MSEEIQSSEQGIPAYFPDNDEKGIPLQIVEEYIKQADIALVKVIDSIENLRASLTQREREHIVISGQKDLLLALQKKFVPVNNIESK